VIRGGLPNMGSTGWMRLRRALPAAGTALLLATAGATGAFAAKPPAPPRPGPWKIILALNTVHGVEITKQVIGGFKVSHHRTVTGFHLKFSEGGESTGCAGGSGSGEGGSGEEPKSTTVSVSESVPIIKIGSSWQVAAKTGSIGGGSVQAEEVIVKTGLGLTSRNSELTMSLVTRKGPHLGDVEWSARQCNIAFVVQPG
jgi:hypothetical protein